MPDKCESMSYLCAKYGARRYKDIDAALSDDAMLQLDGVLVATSHAHHASIGEAVLRAGKHLLMEKPLTADVDEAERLYTLAQAHPTRAFLINNTANWRDGTRACYDACAQGKLGTIRHVNCVFGASLGWLFEGKEHMRWNQTSGTMKGNGFGWGQLSHTFGWLFKVTGLTPAKVCYHRRRYLGFTTHVPC